MPNASHSCMNRAALPAASESTAPRVGGDDTVRAAFHANERRCHSETKPPTKLERRPLVSDLIDDLADIVQRPSVLRSHVAERRLIRGAPTGHRPPRKYERSCLYVTASGSSSTTHRSPQWAPGRRQGQPLRACSALTLAPTVTVLAISYELISDASTAFLALSARKREHADLAPGAIFAAEQDHT